MKYGTKIKKKELEGLYVHGSVWGIRKNLSTKDEGTIFATVWPFLTDIVK